MYKKICPCCGMEFEARTNLQKYCCKDCRDYVVSLPKKKDRIERRKELKQRRDAIFKYMDSTGLTYGKVAAYYDSGQTDRLDKISAEKYFRDELAKIQKAVTEHYHMFIFEYTPYNLLKATDKRRISALDYYNILLTILTMVTSDEPMMRETTRRNGVIESIKMYFDYEWLKSPNEPKTYITNLFNLITHKKSATVKIHLY